ncbi:putative glycosyl transferase [Leishmania major strain Friedlin]|uniref:Fucosyltransferase n=1 Tax=Leishmania major TaxID=5664 RepID=E9ACA8_LEIMA|nr:putative glycosyl transferase [Leishmania major strain Friedlin]CAG9567184.1 glycosyl_transferase_-_putative [Leishmania major strain Friedlin]CBZ11923.1 putative glycosyl transferase [Leishmania major strain Friedlin]|eukprot:XP_003721639.1 putative glycosyl transferase [Leishmania major strain Friedlin]
MMKRRTGERHPGAAAVRSVSSCGGGELVCVSARVSTTPFLDEVHHHNHGEERDDETEVTCVGVGADSAFSSAAPSAAPSSCRWNRCLRLPSVRPSLLSSLCAARRGWTRLLSLRPVCSVASRSSALASAPSWCASLARAAARLLCMPDRPQAVRDADNHEACDTQAVEGGGRHHRSGQRRRHETRATSLTRLLCRAAFIGASSVALLVLSVMLLDIVLGVTFRVLGSDLSGGGLDQLEELQAPWLDCDCAGKDLIGDVTLANTVSPYVAQTLERRLGVVTVATDAGCSICVPSAVRISAAGELVAVEDDEGSSLHALSRLRPMAPLVRAARGLMAYGYDALADVAAVLYPRLAMMVVWCRHTHGVSVERHRVSQLRQRQNRGVAGGAVTRALTDAPLTPLLPPTSLLGVPDGPWANLSAAVAAEAVVAVPYKSSFLVVADQAEARLACVLRAPLSRLFLHRQALPWMTIAAAAHRTQKEWQADPRGRESLLPFPVPPSEEERRRLRDTSRGALRHSDGDGEAPEITIAVTDQAKAFHSYLCTDVPNVSTADAIYHLDPLRALLLRQTDASAKDRAKTAARCTGCVFHCVHPRLARRHGRRAAPAGARGAAEDGIDGGSSAEPLSWDVALEDVDAGHVYVTTGSNAAAGATVTVTREDLFTCKVLNPIRGLGTPKRRGHEAQDDTNRALLLSVDVWLSHAGGGTPLFFSNNTGTSPWLHMDNGSGEASVVRLLPLHTAAIYGESLQSFPNYAMRPSYWLQYDAVYLQNKVRRPDRLSRLLAVASRRRGGGGAAKPRTEFATWTVTHYYMRDFQLVVHLNQLRRQRLLLMRLQGEPANASVSVTAQDAPVALPWVPRPRRGAAKPAIATGALARLAFEVLHGADPLLLPMRGENLHVPPLPVSWSPPTSAEWGSGRPMSVDDRRLPFSGTTGRIPAIAVAISHCWHGRMWWLSELSRYYPVHNYGRCIIPPPAPLPGDATPTRGIPQRAHLSFPSECAVDALRRHHYSALASMQATYGRVGGRRSTSSAARPMFHVGRDHELRCVFRKYRYVLAFENTIEDDYVTEKVYNALLSGALPLFIGAMNIADYVPRASSSVPSRGLSVIPVLQMFPLLNETAWRTEERRVLDLLEEDEAVSRHVLRTHAAVLQARSASAQGADVTTGMTTKRRDGAIRMARTVATALEEVAAQTPHAVASHHYLLYPSQETAVPAVPTADNNELPQAVPHGAGYLGNCSSDSGAAVQPFMSPIGVWPPASALTHLCLLDKEAVVTANKSGGAAPRPAALQSPSTDAYCVGYGQREYLRRVHTDVREAAEAAATMSARFLRTTETLRRTLTSSPPPRHDAKDARRRRPPAVANAGRRPLRRVRYQYDEDWVLTANTAWGFSVDVNCTARQSRRSGATTEYLPRAVQRFQEAPDTTPAQQDYNTPGDMYSQYFHRRSVPPTLAYERELAATAAPAGSRDAPPPPPMSGFAQLAAYLRSLDADPTLVEEAGYFDWWRAERMEDYGDAFLSKLYMPHPVCSICAAALEKKVQSRASGGA